MADRLVMGLWLTPPHVALCVLAWEALFRLCEAGLARLVQRKGFVRSGPGGDAEKLRLRGASYVVALIHALIVAVRGCGHLVALLPAPAEAQLMLAEPTSPWYVMEREVCGSLVKVKLGGFPLGVLRAFFFCRGPWCKFFAGPPPGPPTCSARSAPLAPAARSCAASAPCA